MYLLIYGYHKGFATRIQKEGAYEEMEFLKIKWEIENVEKIKTSLNLYNLTYQDTVKSNFT